MVVVGSTAMKPRKMAPVLNAGRAEEAVAAGADSGRQQVMPDLSESR